MGLSVVKRNQRLMVVDEAGRIIYSPPDFLRNFVRDRREYQAIIDDIDRKSVV